MRPELKLTSADLMWSEKGRECEKLHNKWSKEEISQKNAQTAKKCGFRMKMRLIFKNIVLRSHTFSDDKLNSGRRGEVRDTRIGGRVLTRKGKY